MSLKLNKVMQEMNEEKEMNKHLQQNQAQWQTKVDKLEHKLENKERVSLYT